MIIECYATRRLHSLLGLLGSIEHCHTTKQLELILKSSVRHRFTTRTLKSLRDTPGWSRYLVNVNRAVRQGTYVLLIP
jgi:hypothetical protein